MNLSLNRDSLLDEEFDLLTGIPHPCPAYSRMENGVGMGNKFTTGTGMGNKFTSGDGDREPPLTLCISLLMPSTY